MKATAPTLSQHLLVEARRFRGYPGLAGRGRLNRAVSELWEKALPIASRSVEWIMPRGKGFPSTPALLDEYYSKRLLADVPGIVARALTLRPVESGKTVPRQVNVYYEQATKSFVAGLWDAAVALSRACLEAALEDRLGHHLGHGERDLERWIRDGKQARILAAAQADRATAIRKAGNEILHERSSNEVEAQWCVDNLRQLLGDLYR